MKIYSHLFHTVDINNIKHLPMTWQIRIYDLRYRKQPLYQLSHYNYPSQSFCGTKRRKQFVSQVGAKCRLFLIINGAILAKNIVENVKPICMIKNVDLFANKSISLCYVKYAYLSYTQSKQNFQKHLSMKSANEGTQVGVWQTSLALKFSQNYIMGHPRSLFD